MEKANILVVDDDREIAELVAIHLREEGYDVYMAYSGREALELFDREHIDLVILDIMMPGMYGNEVCERIRDISAVPIIMLSAKNAEMDMVSSLYQGADDYVTKPFRPMELMARVKSQLRRFQSFGGEDFEQSGVVDLKNIWMDKKTRTVKAYGEPVKLTPIEFDLLYLLASHPGQVFATDEIFEKVWKEKSFEMSNTVMVHIRRLRGKIELDPRNAQIIKTVWGVGYKIEE
ncbi:MAG: response regulator transcription factor [Lachnospiraceae bacterium]|nr:response regulator transcription factor [Lachnospiraceae bacterium]